MRTTQLGKWYKLALILCGELCPQHVAAPILICDHSGSDSSVAALGTADGLTLHQEMHLYVHEIGMTPKQALQSATSVTARCFGMPDRGRIAVGCRADLLLVDGNPLEDIDATLNIRDVWRQGHKLEVTSAA